MSHFSFKGHPLIIYPEWVVSHNSSAQGCLHKVKVTTYIRAYINSITDNQKKLLSSQLDKLKPLLTDVDMLMKTADVLWFQ